MHISEGSYRTLSGSTARFLRALQSLIYWSMVTSQTRSLVFARLHWHAHRTGAKEAGWFRFPFGRIRYVDVVSLRQQYDDIFVGRHYNVAGMSGAVRIVDCGGNIGLSTIWFKMRYPDARIVVYEADPYIAQ